MGGGDGRKQLITTNVGQSTIFKKGNKKTNDLNNASTGKDKFISYSAKTSKNSSKLKIEKEPEPEEYKDTVNEQIQQERLLTENNNNWDILFGKYKNMLTPGSSDELIKNDSRVNEIVEQRESNASSTSPFKMSVSQFQFDDKLQKYVDTLKRLTNVQEVNIFSKELIQLYYDYESDK